MTPDVKTIVDRIYDILLHGEGGGSARRRQLEEYVDGLLSSSAPSMAPTHVALVNEALTGDCKIYEEQCRCMND